MKRHFNSEQNEGQDLIMTRKNRQNQPRLKEFHSIPFVTLKGIVVTDAVLIHPETAVVKNPLEPADNGLDLFMQAVADVIPIHKQKNKTATKDSNSVRKITDEKAEGTFPVEESSNDLFIREIGRLKLDTKFADSVPDDGEMKALSGNRLRQVKRGVVSVEYQLDLHGLRREEALIALPRFLRSAIQKGQKAVLVITGKGNHSAEEPVLQQAVASWLREAGRELVVEFAPAPREMGGSGAFVLFLRPGAP
jgi:DNA-nicking Smr family endonuclease